MTDSDPRRNASGAFDPTAFLATKRVERERKETSALREQVRKLRQKVGEMQKVNSRLRQELSDAQDTIDLLLRRNEYLEGSMDDEEFK